MANINILWGKTFSTEAFHFIFYFIYIFMEFLCFFKFIFLYWAYMWKCEKCKWGIYLFKLAVNESAEWMSVWANERRVKAKVVWLLGKFFLKFFLEKLNWSENCINYYLHVCLTHTIIETVDNCTQGYHTHKHIYPQTLMHMQICLHYDGDTQQTKIIT